MNLPDRPELMVIGDSLPQGCRSMTVTADFCRHSYSAQAAALAKIPFQIPAHPRSVLIDLEQIASNLLEVGIPTVLGGFKSNLRAWLEDFARPYQPGGPVPECFDNLAVAGFTIEDTLGAAKQFDGTPGFGTARLAFDNFLRAQTAPGADVSTGNLGDLHIATNARYVLNPSNNPDYMDWSQVRWVAERQPKKLIVHVGHNNGLYRIGSRGLTGDWSKYWPSPGVATYLKLVSDLRASCPDTHILVLGLPKVGAVSNLMPDSDRKIPGTDYFTRYKTMFPYQDPVDGTVVQDADLSIADVNGQIRDGLRGIRDTDFYDVYRFFETLDTKNGVATAKKITVPYDGDDDHDPRNFVLDNNYISCVIQNPGQYGEISAVFADGGLQSIDGMHPSSVAYALLGLIIGTRLWGIAPTDAEKIAFIKNVVKDELLLIDFPYDLDLLRGIINTFGRSGNAGSTDTRALAAQNIAAMSGALLNSD